MAKFYTLQGVDSPPEYYSEHELGSWLSLAFRKAAIKKVSVAAIAKVKVTPPPVKIPVKVSPPPVKVSVATPKISVPPEKLKPSPAEAIKVGQGLQKVGAVSTVVGKGLTVVGGAVSATVIGAPVGGLIAGAGGTLATVGTGLVGAGVGIQQAGQMALDAKGLSLKTLTTKEGFGLVSQISKTSDSLGVTKNASSTINSISNTANQANNISNAFKTGNINQGLDTTQSLLNQIGVKQETTNLVSQGVNLAVKTQESFRSYFPPAIQVEKPVPAKPIFKDPVNDPSHPLYIPPPVEPSKGKISPLPSNQKPQDKKDTNLGLFLAIGVGVFLLTQKKGKRK